MTDNTANLALPFLASGQAQKHVTVNEALLRLDALVQLAVVSATTAAQPAAPTDGSLYILPAGKTGTAWGAMANGALGYYRDGAWEQITPREGWIAHVNDADEVRIYDGAAWSRRAALAGAANIFTQTQTINRNAAAAPVPLSGTNLHSVGVDGSANRYFADAIGGPSGFNLRRANGTLAAATALASGDPIGFFTANGFDGAVYTTGRAAVTLVAAENWTTSANGTRVEIATTPNGSTVQATRLVVEQDGAVRPFQDGAQALGHASYRWATVFATSGAINTSDAREKTPLEPIPEGVKRAARRVLAGIGVFQWREAVVRKGADGARLHIGVTAQAVREAFEAEGLDPHRWGLFCEDPFLETIALSSDRTETRPVLDASGAPATRFGLRSDQLLWLLAAATAPV